MDMISVALPSIIPAACFVRAGYDGEDTGSGGDESAIGRGILANYNIFRIQSISPWR